MSHKKTIVKIFSSIITLFLSSLILMNNTYSYSDYYYDYEYDNYQQDYDYNRYKDTYSNINKYNTTYSNNYYRNYSYNKKCYSGNYAGFRYPTLRQGYTYNSTKRVSNGVRSSILACNNGRISMKSSILHCNYGYKKSGNTCKKKIIRKHFHNSSCRHNYYNNNRYEYNRDRSNSCYSGTYAGYYYPRLNNGRSYTIKQDIVGGNKYLTIKCNNGNIKQTYSRTICESGYYKKGSYCKEYEYKYEYRYEYKY